MDIKNTVILATNENQTSVVLKISYLTYLLPFIGAVIGMVSVYFLQLKKSIAFKLILAFSGAFILGITIHHLIPKVFPRTFLWRDHG